jgi:hypothetical protein
MVNMDILTLNKISKIGLKEFDSNYNILEECENPDGIIVRSASMHEYNFNDKTDHSPGNNSGSSGISQNKNPSSNNDQPKDTFGDVVIEFFEFCFMFALCCVPIFLFSRYILERLLSLFLSEDRSFCISLAISVIIALMSLVLIV